MSFSLDRHKESKSLMPETVISAVKIIAVAYVGLCALVYFRQSKYVYYPEKKISATPSILQLEFEDVVLETEDGESLGAWYIPAGPDPEQGLTLLFCHGNAGNICHRLESISTFHNLGMHVLIFDYHGYGTSTGKPGEAETYEDVLAAWNYLVDLRGVPQDHIVAFGRSLGGAVAAWLAARVDPRALVLESSFTSVPDIAQNAFPFLPARWLSRFKYNTLARLPLIDCPVLVAHGTRDRTVSISHGRRLFEHANEPKQFIEFDGAHNDGGMDTQPKYRAAFMAFINAHDSESSKPASAKGISTK